MTSDPDRMPVSVPVVVREATVADLPETLAIYNELIGSTTGAWSEQLQTLDERRAWFERQRSRGFPVLVAAAGAEVVGMTGYGDFRDSNHWPGYRFTAEHSIHVRGDRRREGIGRLLMGALVSRAAGDGIHVLVGAIDAGNVASIRFHETCGFVEVARMPETGNKFGRWLDLVLMQRILELSHPTGPHPARARPSRPDRPPLGGQTDGLGTSPRRRVVHPAECGCPMCLMWRNTSCGAHVNQS